MPRLDTKLDGVLQQLDQLLVTLSGLTQLKIEELFQLLRSLPQQDLVLPAGKHNILEQYIYDLAQEVAMSIRIRYRTEVAHCLLYLGLFKQFEPNTGVCRAFLISFYISDRNWVAVIKNILIKLIGPYGPGQSFLMATTYRVIPLRNHTKVECI